MVAETDQWRVSCWRAFSSPFAVLVGLATVGGCGDSGSNASEAASLSTTGSPTATTDGGTSTTAATDVSAASMSSVTSSGGVMGTANAAVTSGSASVSQGGTATTASNASSGSGGTGGVTTSVGGVGGSGAAGGGGAGGGGSDVFGITELYPTAPGSVIWTSEHWNGGSPYGITERTDPQDPLQISGMRGDGTLDVTGDGELVMGGYQPRIYIYPSSAGPWRDVEVTVYYKRVADAATAWAGLVIGARSGPEGHGETPCDAHTYYSRLRHDGATDFEKELMHSPSSTQSRVDPDEVWPPDGELPFDVWIGWKYVIYNLPGDAGVKLESYRDLTEGAGGGDWALLNETSDTGGWFTQTSCDEHQPVDGESDLIWREGGTTFIRNTDVTEARYKWVSVREIAP